MLNDTRRQFQELVAANRDNATAMLLSYWAASLKDFIAAGVDPVDAANSMLATAATSLAQSNGAAYAANTLRNAAREYTSEKPAAGDPCAAACARVMALARDLESEGYTNAAIIDALMVTGTNATARYCGRDGARAVLLEHAARLTIVEKSTTTH